MSWAWTCAAATSVWVHGLQRMGRVASGFNDNSPDDSSDNPPAILADCRELALCSPLLILAWWRFILIWKDHQLDKKRSARPCTCADLCGSSTVRRSCAHEDIYTLKHTDAHTFCVHKQRHNNREAATGWCCDLPGLQVLSSSWHLFLQPQLRFKLVRWQSKKCSDNRGCHWTRWQGAFFLLRY